jgi:hypothetical protein
MPATRNVDGVDQLVRKAKAPLLGACLRCLNLRIWGAIFVRRGLTTPIKNGHDRQESTLVEMGVKTIF